MQFAVLLNKQNYTFKFGFFGKKGGPSKTSLFAKKDKLFTNMIRLLTALFLFLSIGNFANANNGQNFWTEVSESKIAVSENITGTDLPEAYRNLELNFQSLKGALKQAPMEFTNAAKNTPFLMDMPMPDGSMATFAIYESPILDDNLAAQFPMIKTYAGYSVENPAVKTRFVNSPLGFNGIINTIGGTVLIRPYGADQTDFYISYDLKEGTKNMTAAQAFSCEVHEDNTNVLPKDATQPTDAQLQANPAKMNMPTDLHTYRIAVATTAEYSAQVGGGGGNVATVLANVTNVMNNVNSLLEMDAAVRLILVDNTTDVFFFDFNDDPYTNGDTPSLILENPGVLNGALGVDGFDIGHVFGTNTGGLASTGSVCTNFKARGTSSTFGVYATDKFYLIVAHEIGHQFNALHNFNMCDGDNESTTTAFEPGSGSSIMCYAGASDCGPNYVQGIDDEYYHLNAMMRMQDYSRSPNMTGCAEIIAIGNNPPEVTIPIDNGFHIPISTPFELEGEATDLDGDNLTYSWEEFDLGPASQLGMPVGTAPSFRSFPPKSTPLRVFPRLNVILVGQSDIREVLPEYTRAYTFRLTARDNHADAGAFGWAEVAFTATETAGPFLVMSPNDGTEEWKVGEYLPVTWDVSNTDNNLVNCQNVNIKLSTDGGQTFPITLLANTPNDGTANVVVPDEITNTARVRIEAADNIFFDLSNLNFSIVEPTEPGFSFNISPLSGQICLPNDFSIDLETSSLLGFSDMINYSVSGMPANAVANFSANPTTPGEAVTLTLDMSAVTEDGNFDLTITAEADGLATQDRLVEVNVVNNDFSSLELLAPLGAGETTLPEFSWTTLGNASSYDIEVSSSPDFSVIIDSANGITGTNYTSSVALEEGSSYYWRVRPENECGKGEFTGLRAFHTVSLACSSIQDNTIVSISGQGLPTVTSEINITSSGIVSDINVTNIRGNHDSVGDLECRLVSPEGTKVVLFSGLSCFVPALDIGFDDQSPFVYADMPCPPNNQLSYQPLESLSAFNDEDALGVWKLEIEVINDLGNGGQIDGWNLEFCGGFEVNNPFVVNNKGLRLPPNESFGIFKDSLFVDDMDNTSDDLEYTIVVEPAEGFLSLDGNQLNLGDTYTQAHINQGLVRYTNTNGGATNDAFQFTVIDGSGGFLGVTQFDFIIDPDAVVNTNNFGMENGISLFPNPANEVVFVSFEKPLQTRFTATIVSVQGQELLRQTFENPIEKIELNTSNLASGIYFISLQMEEEVWTRKVTIE